jgi:hypothetical protein
MAMMDGSGRIDRGGVEVEESRRQGIVRVN